MGEQPVLDYGRDPRDARRWLPLIVGLAIGIRLTLGWQHPFSFPDSLDYDVLAKAIVAHQPYQVNGNIASRMPGYPVFLAIFYAIGAGTRGALAVQAMMGGCVVLITYVIAARLGRGVGLLAAALVAFDPLSIGLSAALLTETPFTLLLIASLWVCIQLGEERETRRLWRLWLGLGILWGIAVYMRAAALWCIVPLAACGLVQMKKLAPELRVAMAGSAVALVFLALTPWLTRNYRHFHSGPLRLTTLEGISLYEAVYPEADGGPKQDKIALPADMAQLNEAERNDEWARRGWGYVRSDPLRIARLAMVKIGRTWLPWFSAAELSARPIQWAMTVWYIPVLLLGLVGMWVVPRRVAPVLWIPILYFTAVHALFLGSVRYRAPLMPIVCIFAAAAIFRVGRLAANVRRAKRSG